jgi:serine/threonine-protein kinase
MPEDPLCRLRDLLPRVRSGDRAARRELEEQLRQLSADAQCDILTRAEATPGDGPGADSADAATVGELMRLVEEARACLTARDLGPTASDSAAPPPAPSPWLPNVPGYELLDVLGRGGMGVVYRARQLGFNRVVALKMIGAGPGADPGELRRFRTEAEAVARLRHPNILQVHDIGEVDGCPYFSMEYLEGGSLGRRARAGPVPPRRAAEVVEALARGMHHAHQAGVVHRDLKPSNVLLDADGTPKVADFGLAKLLDADATRTDSDAVLGTACYMSPEQAAGASRDVGPAADVYGLGAILYDLLTGRPPVERASWSVMLELVRTQDPPDPRRLRPEVDADLEAVCLKCLRKDPARRYASALQLADDLRRWLDGRPTLARPLGRPGRVWRAARRRPFAAAALLLLLVAAVAVPVVVYRLDPDRVPKNNLARLERGQAVPLLGDTGEPAWSREVLGQALHHGSEADGSFTIDTMDRYLLELMPRMPSGGFVFSADVRHNGDQQGTRVGLFFGYERCDGGHCWVTLSFNDFDARPSDDSEPQARADLRGERCRPPDLFNMPAPPTCTVSFPAHVPPIVPMPWRPLRVRVTPSGVQVWCDGRTAGPVPWAALHDDFSPLNTILAASGEPEVHPDFAPSRGVGLFVHRASASFRRVVIEPP